MRPHVRLLTLAVAAIGAAACSSSTSPGGGSVGGHSLTITASSTTTGGSYGSGGNYFFNPTPDTVPAGSTVTFAFGSVAHSVHFDVAGAPDSVPTVMNTSAQRLFPTAGMYPFHCSIHNFHGLLVVK
jgi:plastocyanin